MALETRRHKAYAHLRKGDALLPFEATPLSKVPLHVPYFKAFIEERRHATQVARKAGVTKAQYEQQIKDRYRREGWVKKNRKGEIVADPWKMLRDWEDRYRQKNPEYESPWEPRQRDFRGYRKKVERIMAEFSGATA